MIPLLPTRAEMPVLPLWQRFLLTFVVPNVLFYFGSKGVFYLLVEFSGAGRSQGPDAGAFPVQFALISLFSATAFFVCFVPACLVSLGLVFRPWQSRGSAFGAGMGAMGIGIVCGVVVLSVVAWLSGSVS